MQFAEQIALFDYDKSVDFGVKENGVEQRNGVTVKDITFVGQPDADPIAAYLVTPEGEGSFAGILWVHWLGEEKSNREQFLDEAIDLAKSGTVSLLIDGMWAKHGWYNERKLEEDYANGIKQVIAIRRAMDSLLAQPNVDPARIAFVGHDFGGMYGTLAAGIDQKAKAYAFQAVTPSFFDWAFYSKQPEDKDAYLQQNAPLEPMAYLRQITNASFLFQFAKNDFYVPDQKREEYYANASEPKKLLVYEQAEHSMALPEIRENRDTWLKAQLGLK